MELNNVRIGRACNSSSTHSILIKEQNQPTEEWDGTGEFGWDQFTLTSPTAKDRYLSAMIHDTLCASFGLSVANLIMEEMLHLKQPQADDVVDHQSKIDFPRAFNSEHVDADYIAEFTKFVQRDDVIVLGGNDNGGDHSLSEKATRTTRYGSWGNTHCRRDDRTGLWTIFNRTTGSKVRIAFGDDPGEVKLGSPELVDVKVTNYCPYGCSYCYMGSTKQGEHADFRYLLHLVEVLADLKVFEIALGGGEPTLHPRILDLIDNAKSKGISVGLTTKNYHWAIQNKGLPDAVAFSVDSHAGMVSFLQARDAGVNAHAHIVDGVMPWVETLDIILNFIKERVPVTLLGMKGRVGAQRSSASTNHARNS